MLQRTANCLISFYIKIYLKTRIVKLFFLIYYSNNQPAQDFVHLMSWLPLSCTRVVTALGEPICDMNVFLRVPLKRVVDPHICDDFKQDYRYFFFLIIIIIIKSGWEIHSQNLEENRLQENKFTFSLLVKVVFC